MAHFGEMEKLQKEFGKDVAFLFVYTREAHPDDGPENRRAARANGGWRVKGNKIQIDDHKKYADRVAAAKKLRKAGKEDWRVVVDGMDNAIQKAWGNLPNCAWLIDPTGHVAHKWAWVASSSGSNKRRNDEKTSDLRALLKDKNLAPYSVADDSQLCLRDVRDGEWVRAKQGDDEITTTYTHSDDGVTVTRGEESESVDVSKFDFAAKAKRAKVKTETIEVKDVLLTCWVIESDDAKRWYCPSVPGDGLVRAEESGKVTFELIDAGYAKNKSSFDKIKTEAD